MAEARSGGSGARPARAAGTTGGRSTSSSGRAASSRASSSGRASSARASSARASSASASPNGGPDTSSSEQATPLRGAAGGHVCPVAFCPVGMALTFAEAARPEVVQHLMAAGQELLLAVKAMIDARAEAVSNDPGFEHIRIR